MNQLIVELHVVARHAFVGEIHFEVLPALTPVKFAKPLDGVHGFIKIANQEACDPIGNDLGNRSKRVGDYWRSTSHGFNHHQAERLGPFDRE